MKCKTVDFLEYIEGASAKEVVDHIMNCKKCKKESEKLLNFSRLISTRYIQGRKAEEELEIRLKSIDCKKMEILPLFLQKKISELKEKSLTSRIKKVMAKAEKGEEKWVKSLFKPRLHLMPASPKDITKAKKGSPKKKKN